ncbi:MAG: hypothetical protein U0401_36290 [Anaerolineae bacterium]
MIGLTAFFAFNRWVGLDQIRLAFNPQPILTATPAATPLPTFTSTPAPTPTFTPLPPTDTPSPTLSPTATPTDTPPPVVIIPTEPPRPTPLPPSSTPTSTFTPTSVPSATPCPQPITTTLKIFLEAQPAEANVGCPRAEAAVVGAAWEPFENGLLLWREDTNLIYILRANGSWSPASNTWREGDPAFDPQITPPAGFYQPVRGFGNVWRPQSVRDALGWATAEEDGFSPVIQEFIGGSVWHDPERERFYILFNNGTYQTSPP